MLAAIRAPQAKLLVAVVAWGASFVATKVALRDVSPATVVWLRFSIGFAVLALAVVGRGKLARLPRREMPYLALLGLQGISLHQWLQSNGLLTSQAITTAWIVAATPIFIALLGRLVLKETLGWMRLVGIGLATLGVLLVVTRGDVRALAQGHAGAPGDLLIILSAPNWAVFSILSRRGLKQQPPALMMLWVMGFGCLYNSLWLLAGPGFGEIARLTLPGWLGVGFLGVFCSGLAYIFWYEGLERLPAAQVGAFLYLEPLVTMIVATLLLGEAAVWTAVVGGAVILFGVWLVNRRG